LTADQPASAVLGQASFTSGLCNRTSTLPFTPSADTLCGPAGVAVDGEGNVFVADGYGMGFFNHRVLEYDDPKAAGGGTPGTPGAAGDTTADRVFGQPNFTSPSPISGCAAPTASLLCSPANLSVDQTGNLYVADPIDHRVLVFVNPLDDDETGAVADSVFGQPDFTSDGLGSGPGGLNFPTGVAADAANRVWIADSLGHRVTRYDSPLTTARLADEEYGTAGFFPSRRNFGTPADVDVDAAGNLYVADGMPPANLEGGYSRVLRLNDPIGTDKLPDGVLGQKGYMTFLPNRTDGTGLRGAVGVAIDRTSSPPRVYAVDVGNNRVLGWPDATSFFNGESAEVVLGQPSFKAQQCNQGDFLPSATTLCNPRNAAVDPQGNLWVVDFLNNRVVEYNRPFESGFTANQPAARVYGQADFTGAAANRGSADPTAATLSEPRGVAFDGVGKMWIADAGNFRVLAFDDPLGTDRNADLVIGQASFTSDAVPSSPTAGNFLAPSDLYLDAQRNLYVGDLSYDRVLVFLNPLAPGGGTPGTPGSAGDLTADRVFGQADFTSSGCNQFGGVVARTAQSVCGPNHMAVDGAGSLWLADGGNHRVLRYDSPLTSDSTADAVIGPPDFTTNGIACGVPRTASTFCFPNGLDIDALGNLWVSDGSSHRVLVFDATSTPLPPTPTCDGLTATLIGSDGDDVITGTSGNDVIVGLEGDDEIDGAGGNDVICGGAGDDTLIGGPGDDDLFGQGDDDDLQGGPGADLLDGGGGTDACNGGGGANTLVQCE
jgi:hypothetical protein